MRILVSGSTGVIGTPLVPSLRKDGHEVVRLTRSPQDTGEPEVLWNPAEGTIDRKALEGIDAVIHLAGESIAGIWTEAKKQEIYESRAKGTQLLVRAVSRLKEPPRTFLSASAIGYYGDRGEELLTEESTHGDHFLSQVCQGWEAAAAPACKKGIRLVLLRFGIVLSNDDPTFGLLTNVFKVGLGGKLGDGSNHVSWICIDDAVRAVKHALYNENIEGPVNVVAPNPVRHRELVAALGDTLSRPTLITLPEFATRAVFGQIAETLLLSSMRVRPRKLKESGFRYRYPRIEGALKHLLDRR